MEKVRLRELEVYPFADPESLIDFAVERKGILVAVNALKIANANPVTVPIINGNIGYCDGAGAVMAARTKGCREVAKIPGCELWLKIIKRYAVFRLFVYCLTIFAYMLKSKCFVAVCPFPPALFIDNFPGRAFVFVVIIFYGLTFPVICFRLFLLARLRPQLSECF